MTHMIQTLQLFKTNNLIVIQIFDDIQILIIGAHALSTYTNDTPDKTICYVHSKKSKCLFSCIVQCILWLDNN